LKNLPSISEVHSYHPDHKADLLASGISPKSAWEAGIRTLTPTELGEALKQCGWIDPGDRSGLVFTYPSPNGGPKYFRLKLFPPLANRNGKAVKYLAPKNSTSRLYIPLGVDPQGREAIHLSEGEKKALAMAQAEIPCIAVPGVWSWRHGKDAQGNPQVIPDMEAVNWKRPVIIVFDSDIAINPKVAQAETALAEWLAAQGAEVFVKRLPWGPDKPKGADDFLAKHGPARFAELPCVPFRKINTLEEAVKLAVMPFQDFSRIEIPPARCIVGKWLEEESINLISSQPGMGKTWLAMETGGGAANCRPAMGGLWEVEYISPTLYLDGEMTPAAIQERGRMVGLGNCEILSKSWLEASDVQPPLNLADDGVRNLLLDYVVARGFKLVILDNLFSLFVGLDTNSATDWGPPNQWLLRLRSKGVATLLLHHTGKNETQLGTSSREFNANLAFILKDARGAEDGENCAFSIAVTKQRRRGLGLEGKKYLCVDGEWTVTDIEDKAARKAQLLKMLLAGEGGKAIADALDLTTGRISQLRKELAQDGMIEETGQGRGKVAALKEKGRQWLDSLEGGYGG
jgi:hypothetical protein